MEETKEKKVKESPRKKEAVKKLSYDELENAARQISAQLDAVVKENRKLKTVVDQLQLSNLYTELGFRFKVLEQQDSFNPEFVEECIGQIETIMSSKKEEDSEVENTEENK